MLSGRGVGVDDLLVADLVRVLVVLQVVVRQVRRRIVGPADLAFLTDLDLRGNRVNRRRRVVDVGDRSRRRHRLQILVIDAVLLHRFLQPQPIILCRNANPGIGEQLTHLLGLRLPHLVGVFVEELAAGVLRPVEPAELRTALNGNAVRRPQRVVKHGVEVDVGEIHTLFRTVENPLARQIAVQVHLPQTDGMRVVVALLD
ncbi:Uncharacterised protein [Mycobacteroides abscessus subsp. abscessus]|nr:Uncharacterised protein [Mycobacteroides abscessus subsp. abscessus]